MKDQGVEVRNVNCNKLALVVKHPRGEMSALM